MVGGKEQLLLQKDAKIVRGKSKLLNLRFSKRTHYQWHMKEWRLKKPVNIWILFYLYLFN